MKTLKYFAFAMLTLVIASCGSGSDGNSVTLKVEPELGELSNYLSVTDSEVTITLSDEEKDGETGKVIAGSLAVNVTKAVASNYDVDLEVEVLDKNHVKIASLPDFKIDGKYDSDNGDLRNIVVAGNTRAQMKRGKKDADWKEDDQKMWDKIKDEGVYIVVKADDDAKFAEYKSGDSVETSDVSETSGEEASVDGDTDWDEILDSYEQFVDEYADLLERAQNGDMDAASEYATYMQKAQELGEKLSNARDNMTAAQVARYTKILTKMTKKMK